MNIAAIIGGGCGQRTGQAIPKQFITIYDKPIIAYTMSNIQSCDDVDCILVVCPPGWENPVRAYAKQYGITKLTDVIIGGETRYQSIGNAVYYLKDKCNSDDNIIIQDANRPLTPQAIFKNVIKTVAHGTGVLAIEPCYDSMFESKNGKQVDKVCNRDVLFKGQTPETMKMSDILYVYERSESDKVEDNITSLALRYGLNVVGVPSTAKNLKITTADDFLIIKALLKAEM